MKKTLSYIKPYKGGVAGGLILKFIGSFSELFLPLLLDYMVDYGVPSKDIKQISVLGVLMVVFALAALLGNIFANRIVAVWAGKMTKDLRQSLFAKITYMSSGGVDKFTAPSLVSRLTSDTYYVNQTVASTMRLGVRAPILLIGGIAFTFVLDWRLALVLAACVPFVTVAMFFITKRSVKAYSAVQQGGDSVVRAMQENVSGVRVVKALSQTGYESEKFKSTNEKLTANEFKAAKITTLTNPLTNLILELALVGVIALGAFISSSSGTLIAFLSYFTLLVNAMLGISKIFVGLSRGIASSQRIEQVLEFDGDMAISDCPEGEESNAIEFKNVSFSYNGKVNNINNLSFAVKKGQTLGIIGGTGSGKSTVINLLMRFYDVGEGSVYVDGKDVRSYESGELKTKFGCVFQNDFLFADTIEQNIKYFRDIPDEDFERAVRCACAEEIIAEKEEGVNYRLAQKATNLSGGQKQRLLIARALAGNPEILVLDDSSSALDYATDALFRQNLEREYSHCTKVIVAQRVSAVRNADVIILLNDGQMQGIGTHSELIKDCEEYRLIAKAQMGGEL
ncbi:MAG: ABC transporter ATP-binding protein [Candidatus Coproplasma sp.]